VPEILDVVRSLGYTFKVAQFILVSPCGQGDLIAWNMSKMSAATPSANTGSAKSTMRSVLAYGIVAAFVLLCGHYVLAHWQDFAFVAAVSFPAIAAAGLLVLVSYVLNAYQLSLFLRNFKVSLGFVELMALTTGMLLGNLLIPMRGGTGALALYLKRVHNLDFGSFAAIYGGTAVLIALINSGMAIAALVLLGWLHSFSHPVLSIFVVGIFACCLYLSLFPPPIRWKRSGLLGLAFRAARSWHLLTRNRKLLLALALSFLAMSFALMSAFYLIYSALGMPLSASAVLITSSLGNIANLIPITPGSLGIFDAVMIQVPQIFGLDPARSIAATLVFRVLSFFWAFLFGIPGMIYVLRKGKSNRLPEDRPG
jgi:uncharacterized membrane protein YbhN (UPF0104 family)